MRLTLVVVVLHVLHRREGRLDGDVEALVAGIGDGGADGSAKDVGLAILSSPVNTGALLDKSRSLIHTFTAVFANTLYCSRTRSRSASLGILKRVIRSMGAIVVVGCELSRCKK